MEQISDHVETWRSTFGYWVEREARHARVANAKIKYVTTTRTALPVSVEFFFIAKRETANPALELYHYDSREVSLVPNATTRVATLSAPIVLRRIHGKEVDQGPDLITGLRPFGWVVHVRTSGRIVATAASLPEMPTNLAAILNRTKPDQLKALHDAAERRLRRKD
jgi:hypothetical protein